MKILRQNNFSSDKYQEKLNQLGEDTIEELKEAVRGSSVENKVLEILERSSKEMREQVKECQKEFMMNQEYAKELQLREMGLSNGPKTGIKKLGIETPKMY